MEGDFGTLNEFVYEIVVFVLKGQRETVPRVTKSNKTNRPRVGYEKSVSIISDGMN